MKTTLVIGAVLASAAIWHAAGSAAPQVGSSPADRTFTIEPLASPAALDSESPQITVEGSRAILSWIESDDKGRATLKFSNRTAAGWSEPQAVVSNDILMVNPADVPSVRQLADGTLVAAWTNANPSAPDNDEASDLRLAWSRDEGKTWSRDVSPHHDGTATQHGFVSLFRAPGDGVGLVWLDGRATRAGRGNMALRGSVFGPDAKQRTDVVIDPRVCECCPTATAVTAEGPVVAYRDRSAQEVRDIYVSRLSGGRWSAPALVHRDGWRIEACPVNGPALSARDRTVAVAWFTAKEDQGQAFAAFSSDGGRTFDAPIRIDDEGSLGRVQIALLDDGAAVAGWVEFSEKKSQFKIRRIEPGGRRAPATVVADLSGIRIPRLARVNDELLLSWTATEDSSSRVKTARVTTPPSSRGR